MDDSEALYLVGEFLKDIGMTETLATLQKESVHPFYKYDEPSHKHEKLKSILDDYAKRREQAANKKSDMIREIPPGDGCYAKHCWSLLDALTGGANVLSVRLFSSGRLLFSSADKSVYTAELPLPLEASTPPTHLITTRLNVTKAAILCIDVHPKYRDIAVMGGMDRNVFLVNLDDESQPVIATFSVHKKYVTHALWCRDGKCFASGSHDKTVCFYKMKEESPILSSESEDGMGMEFEMFTQLDFKGAVECMAVHKDGSMLVVGCRGDNYLHIIECDQKSPKETRAINLNAINDDFVSFTPMCLSFSPDSQTLLVSTDKDRIILISWEDGYQIANFYEAMNDEFSQPRHCWHPSGLYIYGTSQDRCIYIWEVRTQKVVCKLSGHTNIIRDLDYCKDLKLLVSCGFDGSIRLWTDTEFLQKDI